MLANVPAAISGGGGGGGGLSHLPIGNARPLCTAGAFPIFSLTTKVPTGLRDNWGQLSLYLSPSHPAPSPLAVIPPYLPLCAPSQPIETIKTPCVGEGAMIIAGQIPTYDTTKIGLICLIHTYFTPILVHLFMETFGDLSEF